MPIFISYSRVDSLVLGELTEDLEALGFAYWFDRELTGGQQWWTTILRELRESHVVLLVTTPASLASDACKSEYQYALALGKVVVPVIADATVSLAMLPEKLRAIQAVSYSTRDRPALRALAKALAELSNIELRPSVLPDPLPAEPPLPLSGITRLRDRLAQAQLPLEEQKDLLQELSVYLGNNHQGRDAAALLEQLAGRTDTAQLIAVQARALLKDWKSRETSEWPAWASMALKVAGYLVVTWLAVFATYSVCELVYERSATPVTLVVFLASLSFGAYRVYRWRAPQPQKS